MSIKVIRKTENGYHICCGSYPTANYDALLTPEPRDHITRLIRANNGRDVANALIFIRSKAKNVSAKIVPGTTENYYLVFTYADLDDVDAVELRLKHDKVEST